VDRPRRQPIQSPGGEADIASAPVRFRAVPDRQPGLFQCSEVVREQVRGHAQLRLQLTGREVSQCQKVNNAQARRISEGRVLGYPRLKRVNCLNIH